MIRRNAVTDLTGRRHLADTDGEREDIPGRQLRASWNYPIMRCGNQSANIGNAIRMTSRKQIG